jgi:hypothetical protein
MNPRFAALLALPLVACQLALGLEPPHEDARPQIDAAAPVVESTDAALDAKARFSCADHPNAWFCDDFDEDSITAWVTKIIGCGARIELSTVDFRSPPSSLHAVMTEDVDAGACATSGAFVEHDRATGAPTHLEFSARIVKTTNTGDTDLFKLVLGPQTAIVATPTLVYAAETQSLGFEDNWGDGGKHQLGAPGSAWFHIAIDIHAGAATMTVEREGQKDSQTTMQIPRPENVSAGFGLLRAQPGAFEIYIDDVLAE